MRKKDIFTHVFQTIKNATLGNNDNNILPLTSMATGMHIALESLQRQTKRARKGCSYNEEEMMLLCKYKKEYKSKTTHQERDMMLRNYILVDIFNYWSAKNIELGETEVQNRTKV